MRKSRERPAGEEVEPRANSYYGVIARIEDADGAGVEDGVVWGLYCLAYGPASDVPRCRSGES